MRVDRENRDRLVEVINRFLDDDLTSHAFEEEIEAIDAISDDPTIGAATHSLWHFYDDFLDHKVVASKEEWDYLQRLLLVLKSDAHLKAESRLTWLPQQAFAAPALALFALAVLCLGWGWHLIWVTLPLGIVSILLSRWRERSRPLPSQRWVALTPFDSVSQLLAIRRGITGFAKRRYPPHLQDRRLRGPGWERQSELSTYAFCIAFSPMVLFWQSLPERETEERVVSA